jgi:hypothetical protein
MLGVPNEGYQLLRHHRSEDRIMGIYGELQAGLVGLICISELIMGIRG